MCFVLCQVRFLDAQIAKLQSQRFQIKNLLMPLFLFGCFSMDFVLIYVFLRPTAFRTTAVGNCRIPQKEHTFCSEILIASDRNSRLSIAIFLFLCLLQSMPDTAAIFKNLLMPLFLMVCFSMDFQEVKRPLGTKSVKRPIKVGKRPINEGKRPIKAMVLVGISVGCLMGCFRTPPPWRKTAPLKRPIKRSMIKSQ